MKNKSYTYTIKNLAILSICCITLSGCAGLPFQETDSYFRTLYKRIPYMIKGRYRIINIFYSTDRNIRGNDDTGVQFGNELAAGLIYGKMDVRIDPSVRIGKVLPGWLKKMGIVGIQKSQNIEQDAFIKQLGDAIKASPHNSLLVLVFGYKDDFEATAIKAAYFAYLLDINTPILLFDWPGDQSVSICGYEKALSMARDSGPRLGKLLARIIREAKPNKLWIKASSLGCQIVCDGFDYMYQQKDLSDPDAEIDHVILAAPDVGLNEFDEKFKDELTAMSRNLTVYVSSNDDALLLSSLVSGKRRLGRQDFKYDDQGPEAKDMLYLKSLKPEKITLIDVTPINRSSYRHGYYLEAPEFYDDFYLRVFDSKPSANRHLYLLKYKDNIDYWVMQSEGSK